MVEDTTESDRAMIVAISAHSAVGQVRKYSNEPYYRHCERVAGWVTLATLDEDSVVAAAYLHDVIEDTWVTKRILSEDLHFSSATVALVDELTNKCHEGSRATRARNEAHRLWTVSPDAQTIKYADILDNMSDIAEHDSNFAIVYAKEKLYMLEGMTEGLDTLRKLAIDACERVLR